MSCLGHNKNVYQCDIIKLIERMLNPICVVTIGLFTLQVGQVIMHVIGPTQSLIEVKIYLKDIASLVVGGKIFQEPMDKSNNY